MTEFFTGEGTATPGSAAHIYLGMLTAGHVVDPATFYAWGTSQTGMEITETEMDRITRIYFAFLQQQQLLEELAGNPGSSGTTSATTPGNPGSSGGPGGPAAGAGDGPSEAAVGPGLSALGRCGHPCLPLLGERIASFVALARPVTKK